MQDPNYNTVWDALLGGDTNTGVVRLIGLIALLIVVGGSIFWLAH